MERLPVYNFAGEKIGEVEPPEFFAERISEPAVYAAVKKELAGRRRGTASTKTRGEVRGGGRKPWRQKGTGRARAGSIRSPLWRGGGVVFGPRPRDYWYPLPKKLRRLALRSALAAKFQEGNLFLLGVEAPPEPKTKVVLNFLSALGLPQSVLFVGGERNDYFLRATRNLEGVSFMPVGRLGVYEVLRHEKLALTPQALAALKEVL